MSIVDSMKTIDKEKLPYGFITEVATVENNQPQPRYRFHIHDDITDPGTRTIAGTTTAASRANIPVSLPDWIDQEERVCQMILAELEAADAEAAVQEQK